MQGDPAAMQARRKGTFRRVGIGLIIALAILLVSVFRGAAIFYTDFLWFGSVHLTSVWSGLLVTKIMLAAVAIAFFFVLLWVNLWVVDRYAPRSLTFNQEDELARKYQEFVRPRAGRVRLAIAAFLALIAGVGFSSHWRQWLMFRNGGSFGAKDPQFHMDIGFFVFKLPFLNSIADWVFYGLILAIIVSLMAHYLQGAIRPQATHGRITSAVKAQISILVGLLAIVRAVHYWLERYELSYSNRGPVTGANYTDVHYLLPALMLLTGISLLAGLTFFAGMKRRGWSLPAITVVLWAVVSLLLSVIIPAGVEALAVKPAESQKEAPYIQRNINATRAAIGLQNVQSQNFQYTSNLTASQLLDNAQTIRNVRLWDPQYLKPVYQRLQENRSFFIFNDIDVDRYQYQDQETQFELSVRELNNKQLPSGRRSWVNEHLQYTHGYGAVASPANAVTSNGDPDFTLQDLPPTGFPSITRPQIYFGENTPDYSIVNTDQPEVDYVSTSGADATSKYQGSGGVKLSSFARKVAFAARVGNINPLISDLVNKDSKAMYYTNIRSRVMKVAPFLSFDGDPYPIVSDGHVLWMQDAYTTSNQYPYANEGDTSLVDGTTGGLKGQNFNYIRNSVKITIDAYDGTMKFYVMDNTDPIVKAWQKAFPKLFTDGSQMPESVRQHIRYPEDLFRVQSEMYGSYHMTDAQDFYTKSDRWNVAQKPEFGDTTTTTAPPNTAGVTASTNPEETRIEPYYLLMKLPGDSKESFLMFQPFVPYSQHDERKELSAFMVAKSDPDDYGQMTSFVMPRDQQIDGPALVEARIQQDPSIKQYITLLNQSGSQVQLGNMLLIPIDNSLLYVRPLYITSSQTQVPQFKKAIVVQGNNVAMEDTLQQALSDIFGTAPATLEQQPTQGAATQAGASPASGTTGTPPSTTTTTTAPSGATGGTLTNAQVQALLNQANSEFDAADQALRNGDLAGYQQHVQAGENFVRQARGSS